MSAAPFTSSAVPLLSRLRGRVAAGFGACLRYNSFPGKFRLLHGLCPHTGDIAGRVGKAIVNLDLSDLIQRNMLLGTMYEEDRKRLRSLLRPGSIFFDVGANAGFFSLVASELVGSAGRVIAFEPNPTMHARLEKTLRENGIGNVSLYQLAMGAEPGTLPLYPNREPGNSTASMVWDGQASQMMVPVDTVDGFMKREGITSVDMLKIDVDGLEPQILRGGLAALNAGCIKHVQVEFCEYWQKRNGGSCRDIEQLLVNAGFVDMNPGLPWNESAISDRCFRWVGPAQGS